MQTLRTIVALGAAFLVTSAAAQAQGNLIGLELRGKRLVSFDAGAPGTLLSITPIVGLAPGEALVGIDVRPSTGELVGISTTSRVYFIDPLTGVALAKGASSFAPSLNGRGVGLDFNPVPDRLRVVTNWDQSLRLNADTGAVAGVDTSLAYAPGDAGFGANPNVVACAYTNAFAGATSTTLYGIDSERDVLVRIGGVNGTPSPNGGQLSSVGALGVNTGSFAGMDISAYGGAFAVMNLAGESVSKLYTLNLATGAATLQGAVGGQVLRDIAVRAPVQPLLWGATSGNRLVSFVAGRPGAILSNVPFSGLQPNETIEGLDVRPATGELLALGSSSRIYRVERASGALTPIGAGPFTPALTGSAYGFDFNPAVDRIRNVSDAGQNLRLNPNTGAVAAVDTLLAYAPGDSSFGALPRIVAEAYTNNFAGSTNTTLYAIDATNDKLVTQGSIGGAPQSPNGGQLFSIGALGVDTGDFAGLDITPFGGAFAALAPLGDTKSTLYTLNVATGAATPVGEIPVIGLLRALAAEHPPVARAVALSTDNQLLAFDLGTPGSTSSISVTGLQPGETLLGIDARPATGALIGVSSANRLYSINRTSGAAVAIGGGFTPALVGAEIGVDFNPTVDRVRLVTDAGQNLRLNPITGALAAVDANLAFAGGDVNAGALPREVAVAYDRNFAGATVTTMFGIDSNLDVLVTQGSVNSSPTSPNSGQLFTVGALGVNAGDLAGFDISALGGGFVALTAPGALNSTLYSINLTTGATSMIGAIGGGVTVRDLALLPAGL
ncbi:MAG: DUF4394 domain-containing protein [Planctomycetes bacterium]|nr:DUF4394 domain-containing protein [Planctomycetota bacterium]